MTTTMTMGLLKSKIQVLPGMITMACRWRVSVILTIRILPDKVYRLRIGMVRVDLMSVPLYSWETAIYIP